MTYWGGVERSVSMAKTKAKIASRLKLGKCQRSSSVVDKSVACTLKEEKPIMSPLEETVDIPVAVCNDVEAKCLPHDETLLDGSDADDECAGTEKREGGALPEYFPGLKGKRKADGHLSNERAKKIQGFMERYFPHEVNVLNSWMEHMKSKQSMGDWKAPTPPPQDEVFHSFCRGSSEEDTSDEDKW